MTSEALDMKRKLLLITFDLLCMIFVGYLVVGLGISDAIKRAPRFVLFSMASTTLVALLFRFLFRIYSYVLRYATTRDYIQIVLSDACAAVVYYVATHHFDVNLTMIRTITVFSLMSLLTLTTRFCYRIFYDRYRYIRDVSMLEEAEAQSTTEGGNARKALTRHLLPQILHPEKPNNRIKIAIVGAGNVGTMLAKELQRNPLARYSPFVFIDNDPRKIGSSINGVRVISSGGDIVERLSKMPVQEIVLALPRMSGEEKQELFNLYAQTGCTVMVYDYPLEYGALNGGARTLRPFRIEELLFRDARTFDSNAVLLVYRGRTVLVTGGGGSIGSELCRQLARLQPGKLVIFDIYENNAYDIEQELRRLYGGLLNVVVEIGSVRDQERLYEVFDLHKPDIVFHAAAHKHVPLMEHSCAEAVKNNVFGTLHALNAAQRAGVKRFLLVSTDKAVNPTNVMGATKRLCEMLVQSRRASQTKFVAVRFGNVLGSNGSVIPLFTRQIQAGGPVTLTDKRIIRYFMTIPEAAQLLLQACAMAKAGEIYVLDMGKPIRILTLAENMIRLSGLTPYTDIEITETGLRPGEKLYEELLIKTEQLDKTDNQLIFIERDQPISEEEMNRKLDILRESLRSNTPEAVLEALRQTVPTYRAADEINQDASETAEMELAMGS